MPILKIIFYSRVLRLSEMPRCRERPLTAICICWLTDLGDKVSVDWFGCVTFYVNSTKGYNIRDLFLCSLFLFRILRETKTSTPLFFIN